MCFGKIVFFHYFRCDVPVMETHVLIDGHGGNEKEIFEIASAVFSIFLSIGNCTVDMQFAIGMAYCWRTNILKGIEFVSAYHHANAIFFCFTRTHGANKIGIC